MVSSFQRWLYLQKSVIVNKIDFYTKIIKSSRLYRMSKGILGDFVTYIKIKNSVLKNSENKLKVLVDTWVERLNGKPFHGGESPDAADFRVII